MERDAYLIQIKVSDDLFLILTQIEFDHARRRGDSVIHNRNLKGKEPDAEIIEAKEVIYV
jgi:hypothetical protein